MEYKPFLDSFLFCFYETHFHSNMEITEVSFYETLLDNTSNMYLFSFIHRWTLEFMSMKTYDPIQDTGTSYKEYIQFMESTPSVLEDIQSMTQDEKNTYTALSRFIFTTSKTYDLFGAYVEYMS
jgi:hypothetical protein